MESLMSLSLSLSFSLSLSAQDVVDSHPGLEFLQSSPEFHARYIETVIGRIFYTVDRSWRGQITVQDLRLSNFLQTLRHLEEEDDINKVHTTVDGSVSSGGCPIIWARVTVMVSCLLRSPTFSPTSTSTLYTASFGS